MTPELSKKLAVSLLEEEMASRRLAESTRQIARDGLKLFFRWCSQRSKTDIRTISKKDLVAYHTWLSKQLSKRTGHPFSHSVVNRSITALKNLYSCMYRSKIIMENPFHNLSLRLPREYDWKRRPLTRSEIERFLESIDTTTALGLRDRCLYELIYSSGLRCNEAACLKVGNIDFDRRLMVVRGKFSKDRVVPFSTVAHDFLLLYLGKRIDSPDDWVFYNTRRKIKNGHLTSLSINARLKKRLKDLGMDKPELSAHSIRFSTATHLLENGASIRHVQELLGHADIKTTARYTQVMTDNVAKMHRKHHPREHELFEAVDEEYERRLAQMLNRKLRIQAGKIGKNTGTMLECGRGTS